MGLVYERRIRMSRSRPYKKNDNAWVEQKNWTHVRKIVGYRRFDTTTEMRLLNDIYSALRLYKNFCLPTIKLVSKTREGGHIRRVYDEPRTPYQRLMESGQIDGKTKQQLRSVYEGLNPAALNRHINELREQLEAVSASKAEIARKPAHRGPGIRIGKRRGGNAVAL